MTGLALEPEIPVTLGMSHLLVETLAGAPEAALRQALGDTFRRLLTRLGLPGQPVVTVHQLAGTGEALLCLWVNGRRCRYPSRLLQRVYWYLQAEPFAPGPSVVEVESWLTGLARADDPAGRAIVEDFICLACAEIVRPQAAVLLGHEQVQAYAYQVPTAHNGGGPPVWPPADWLAPTLALTVQHAISLADRETVFRVLQAAWQSESQPANAAEALIDALMPDRIRVLIARDDLQRLTAVADPDPFPMMRDGLFYELGMRYPAIEFTYTDDLKPNAFAFEINQLTTLPWIGLQPDQALVNEEPQKLAQHMQATAGRAGRNPANDNTAAVIPAGYTEGLVAEGYTTWDSWGYLVLALSSELRQSSSRLLSHRLVETYIAEVAAVFPALVTTFRGRSSPLDLTRCLRRLLAEQISIRDMRRILERLCDFDYIVADDSRLIIFDDRLAAEAEPNDQWLSDPGNLAEFVRQGMKAYISHKHTRGQSTLAVLLLAPDLEEILRNSRVYGADKALGISMGEESEDEILQQIDAEIRLSHGLPAILSTSTVRPALRALLAQAMPDVPALSYQELSPDLNISPVARISLAGS